MLLILMFAFLAGVVTILSPCIFPLLPVILSSSGGTDKRRPVGVVIGFIASFTFFTLFLSTLVRLLGIPAESLRLLSILVLAIFGLSYLIPSLQARLELFFSKLASITPQGQEHTGLVGGVIIGLSLGLLWTPCVGPILASVISLAIAGEVSVQAFLTTLSYSVGTAIPMLIIMMAGSTALQRVPWLVRNTARIQKVFGGLMILTAVGIWANIDRQFQTFFITTFPNYGVGLTRFEDNIQVKDELSKINSQPISSDLVGKPMPGVSQSKWPLAPELIRGGEWLNSDPLQLSSLRGKVVLVDFWTYTCINCQRTLPYLKSWWDKYRDKGLVIVGVHAPEFEFEKDAKNVARAIEDFGLTYPVMQDNKFATWRAYNNRYWPAKYLIDKDGVVRYTHFGEGEYDETEKKIQELLLETGATMSTSQISNPQSQIFSRTPELYLGYARMEYLASPEDIAEDNVATYSLPQPQPGNTFALEGEWTVMPEYAAPSKGAKLQLSFEAGQVFLVARPKNGQAGAIKISLDGQLKSLGEDVSNGQVKVDADRLYKLIKLAAPGKHVLEIEFLDSSVEVYAFTFG